MLLPIFPLELINGEVLCGMATELTASHLLTCDQWESSAHTAHGIPVTSGKALHTQGLCGSLRNHSITPLDRQKTGGGGGVGGGVSVISSLWRPYWRTVSSRPVWAQQLHSETVSQPE